MAQIHNSETIKRILDDAKIQTSVDNVPTRLAEKVVPVLIANPARTAISRTTTRGTTTPGGGGIIYTTSSTNDFYLCSAYLSLESDVTCDDTTAYISIEINGQVHSVLVIAKLTTVAGRRDISLTFPVPVKVDRGTDIDLFHAFTVGTSAVSAGITGYEVENGF